MQWLDLLCLVFLALATFLTWIVYNALRQGVIWLKGTPIARADKPAYYAFGVVLAVIGLLVSYGIFALSLFVAMHSPPFAA